MSDKKIKVFLADDHQILLDGIAALVAEDPLIQIVGRCNDSLQLLSRLEAAKPDVLVLDISLPGVNGLDLCRLVKAKMPEVAIVMLTMHSNTKCVTAALENGATGYLIKETASPEFCKAIYAVVNGKIYLGKGIPTSVLDEVNLQKPPDPDERLTDRERQVLWLLTEGKSNQQIAQSLQVPISTVAADHESLMQKLDIQNQDELVKHAIRKFSVMNS